MTQGQRHALSESPFGTGRPISVRERMSCSLGVCFGPCRPLPSVFIFLLSFLLSSAHPFRPSKILVRALLHRILCKAAHLRRTGGMLSQPVFDSGRDTTGVSRQICRFFVKVLSTSSWNYLGAKLIALDPTSRCNRLSANLGCSQCRQVSPGQCYRAEPSTAPLLTRL